MDTVRIGNAQVSRFILGSNPFSGFSHQGTEMDERMKHYFTVARIKETLREAERLGVNTVLGRTDHHVMRWLMEYWDEGGGLQWFAQTCPGVGPYKMCVQRAADGKAKACHIHGGIMDFALAQGKAAQAEIPPVINMIHDKGMAAGIAGHNTRVFEWAEETNLNVDYYMCCYYNSDSRDRRAEHQHGATEWFVEEDRQAMTKLIAKLSKPVIHYKVMAAGRNDPKEAFAVAARNMRATDAVCVGIYDEKKSGMLKADVAMFEEAMRSAAAPARR